MLVCLVAAVGGRVLVDATARLSFVLLQLGQSLAAAAAVVAVGSISRSSTIVCLLFVGLGGGLVRVGGVQELVEALGENPVPADPSEEAARRAARAPVAVQRVVFEPHVRPAAG